MGHNPLAYTSRPGIFDGLIGHQCSGWDEWQLTLHELCGMSLRGLVQTAPAGFILFAYGYGIEYMISGVLMGAVYSVGWELPFPAGPFGQGIALSEVLWGAWTWAVLFYVIMTSRKRPVSTPARTIHGRRTSILRKIVFYTFLALVDAIFIAACATYGQVTQPGMCKYANNVTTCCADSLLSLRYGQHGPDLLWNDRINCYLYRSPTPDSPIRPPDALVLPAVSF